VYHRTVTFPPHLPVVALALAAGLALAPAPSAAQGMPFGYEMPTGDDPRSVGQREQLRFETFRRANLPAYRGRTPGRNQCQEQVGRFCYWYDEDGPAPAPEHPRIGEARVRLIAVLDSLGRANPADNWIAGQRVRYLNEAGRHDEALEVARTCEAYGWWCQALEGFALHALQRYPEAEQAYERALAGMSGRERCTWRDISPFLDDDTRREYIRTRCGEAQRERYEDRVWWFARTRYGMPGNDARTEHFARLTYAEFLRDAPSVHSNGFDESERELLLRFGWPVAWARGPDVPVPPGGDRESRFNVVSLEPTPAHRYIPPYEVLANPAMSDSTQWAVQRPPVVARYHPPYATRILMLEHQAALFRRGDSALVALAYDVGKVESIGGAELEAALVLTPGTPGARTQGSRTIRADAPPRGTLTVRAPWGPLLMSAEIAAPARATLVRARYGIRPPFAVRARVVLSDLLFYAPYGEFPATVEEVLPHAFPTQKVRAGEPLGVYWEAYNTDPAGERMTISLTVVPETEEAGVFRRGLRALRLARESAPVSFTVEDFSARGSSTSPRAVALDISTLKAGDYLVQLEITVAGQYTIRADRRIVVTGP
jgi:hypothetical protein